jgi:hypothetical protein
MYGNLKKGKSYCLRQPLLLYQSQDFLPLLFQESMAFQAELEKILGPKDMTRAYAYRSSTRKVKYGTLPQIWMFSRLCVIAMSPK